MHMANKISGINNSLYICKDNKLYDYSPVDGLNININGNDNVVIIHMPTKFVDVNIVMGGNGNRCEILPTEHRYIRHTTLGMENGGTIRIGRRISVYKNLHVVAKAGCSVDIGDECMIASDIIIRNDDGHVITDRKTGKIINPPENIIIENNVWIANRAMILKGARVPAGSVVGAMSLVTDKFEEENIIIGGVPASKIRGDICWNRKDYYEYCKQKDI